MRGNRKIIGLSGPAGSGKNAAAEALRELGYSVASFAAPLRQEAWAMRTAPLWERIRFILDNRAPWRAAAALLVSSRADIFGKPTPRNARVLLQWWGTEYRRAQDPDYWIKLAERSMGADPIVFADVRFENEAAMIRKRSGIVVCVDRPRVGPLPDSHVSERGVVPDVVILNDGTLDELRTVARHVPRMNRSKTPRLVIASKGKP